MAQLLQRPASAPLLANGSVSSGAIGSAAISAKSQKALAAVFMLALASVGLFLPFL